MNSLKKNDKLAVPCVYMIFDADGYHECELTRCLCAWFYDVCNPGFTVELSVNEKTGKVSSVSTFDFPDSEEYKDMVKRTMTEDDVPKLCPRGFTWKEIDAKIKPLMDRVQWGHRPMDQVSLKHKEVEK